MNHAISPRPHAPPHGARRPPALLHSWEAVDAALARLSKLQPQVARLQARLEAGLALVKERHQRQLASLAEETEALRAAIGDFLRSHRAELVQNGGRKSRQLSYGRVGLHLSPPKLTTTGRTTWEKVLERVVRLPPPLRQKLMRTRELLDREALKKAIASGELPPEQRKALGVRIEQQEQPYYDLAVATPPPQR